MPQSRPRRRKGHGEVMPPLNVSERIDSLLKEHLSVFPSKPELTDAEIEHWHKDLSPWPIAAIEWAFDCWRRNGRFFPVYGDILDLVTAWEPAETTKRGCSRECKNRHGKGYNENDIAKLFKMYTARMNEISRPITDAEIEVMLYDLDKWRGKSPEWRVA
jgi:hypothetical protein